jgi:hypothetical protein
MMDRYLIVLTDLNDQLSGFWLPWGTTAPAYASRLDKRDADRVTERLRLEAVGWKGWEVVRA